MFDIYLTHRGDSELRYLPKERHISKKYVFFSPYGGVGKTTAAMTAASILAEKQSVLVVNLEMFPKTYFWEKNVEQGKENGVSELFYYMGQSHCNLEMKIKSMVTSMGNADYLSGVSNLWDLQDIQEKEMLQFIHGLEKYTGYDVLIFDISFLSKGILALFEECTNIIIPVLQKEQNHTKWYQSFSKKEQAILEKKVQTILLPKMEHIEELTDIQYLKQGAYGEELRKYFKKEGIIYEMRTEM